MIQSVHLHRPDIVRRSSSDQNRIHRQLLSRGVISELRRHGKQLALIAEDSRVLVVRLGMTGQLRRLPPGGRCAQRDHIHCTWLLADGHGRLFFRDPRRFGGLYAYASCDELLAAWSALGPDAAHVRTQTLLSRLSRTRRTVKAALLDQKTIAGIGNIYADEALHLAGIHPEAIACELDRAKVGSLNDSIHRVLATSLARGGTTFRDYVDGNGRNGDNRAHLYVYGRSGSPCRVCSHPIRQVTIAQRSTCFCPHCQPAQQVFLKR